MCYFASAFNRPYLFGLLFIMKSYTIKVGGSWLFTALLGLSFLPVRAQTAAAPAAAASAAATAGSPLDGFWKGPLKVPGGQLDVAFRVLKLSGGEYFATLDVPQQKVSRMTVKVETPGDTIRFIAEEANSRFTGQLSADGKQLVGNWQQPGFKTPITLSFAPVPALTDKNIRLTPPYREEDVTFSNSAADVRLGGQLTIPPGLGPFPAVALLSDAGPQDRNGTVNGFGPLGQLADYLTRRGFAVLRFDDRGVGKSTGQTTTAGADRVSDAQAAINYLRTRPELDVSHLGLIGHGEGGDVALLAASQPLPPAFVITLAAEALPDPALILQRQTTQMRAAGSTSAQIEAALKQKQAILEIIRLTPDNAQAQPIVANMLHQSEPTLDAATVQTRATEMTSPYYRYALSFMSKLTGVTCPVLLLHGTADTSLECDATLARLDKALSLNKKVTTKKLPDVNHLFQPAPGQWPIVSGQPQPTLSPLAEETIREWLVAQVKK
jgi:alpha/beta superfamily hydrolase